MNPIDNYDAFWQKLKQTEKAYAYLSLDPGRRLWIDTYPPFMLFDPPDAMPVDHRRQTPLEAISSACRHEPFSLYFHIGFCRQRCAYCRQYEVEVLGKGQNPGLLERYVDQLKRDVDRSLELFPYLDRQTFGMYFGGGTPSILSLRQLEKLLSHLRSIFDRRELTPGSTFEVNPMHSVFRVSVSVFRVSRRKCWPRRGANNIRGNCRESSTAPRKAGSPL